MAVELETLLNLSAVDVELQVFEEVLSLLCPWSANFSFGLVYVLTDGVSSFGRITNDSEALNDWVGCFGGDLWRIFDAQTPLEGALQILSQGLEVTKYSKGRLRCGLRGARSEDVLQDIDQGLSKAFEASKHWIGDDRGDLRGSV